MVIFTDLQKLLLFQRLNLGFECDICKRKFFNSIEHLQHTINCKRVPEQHKCTKCGKTFGHHKILQLHLQIHNLSESSPQTSTNFKGPDTSERVSIPNHDTSTEHSGLQKESEPNSNEVTVLKHIVAEPNKSAISSEEPSQTTNPQTSSSLTEPSSDQQQLPTSHANHSVRVRRKTVPKKKVGLTKVRMEDCLRCDACSCIYLDHRDYYKHMRNFHHVSYDNSPLPPQRSKRKCRSCCKQCRGVNCGGVKRSHGSNSTSNLFFTVDMRDNIQDRWMRMMAQQLSGPLPLDPVPAVDIKLDPDAVAIKPDPDPAFDLSLLLSQVEVKIKTEPADDYDL